MSQNIGFLMLILTVNLYLIKPNKDAEITLIKKFVQKQTIPGQIYLSICWNKYSTLNLAKELQQKEMFAQFLYSLKSFASIINHSTYRLIIADAKCNNFENLIEYAENSKLFMFPNRWLILTNETKIPIPLNTNLLFDSNFIVATLYSDQTYRLKTVFKYSKDNEKFSYNDVGIFSIKENDFWNYNNFDVSINRTDLHGTTINVSYVVTQPNYPYDFQDYRYRHIDSFSRLGYILTLHILEVINSTGFFIPRESWSYKPPNSSLYGVGMLGDIQRGTADIAGTVSFYILERLEIIEYLSVTSPTAMRFLMKAPPLSYVRNLYILPFQKNVWYSLYFIAAATILLFYVIIKCENKNVLFLKEENNVDNIKPKFFDVVMAQVGAITQQGSDAEPRTLSGRIALFIILLVMMFLYTAYSASIVVLLQSTSDSIRTVKDLLNSKIELGGEDIVYNHYYLKYQDDPIRKALYNKKIANNFLNVTEGIKRLRNGFFGFHLETSGAYKVIKDTFQEHEKCGLLEIDYLNLLYPSLSIKKGSHLREVIKIGSKKIIESGIRQRQVDRIYFKKPQCHSKEGNFVNIGLLEVYFPFLIFSAGILCSCFILLIELLVKNINYY